MKNIVYQFIENQTLISTFWHSKLSLVPNKPIHSIICKTTTHVRLKAIAVEYTTYYLSQCCDCYISQYFSRFQVLGCMHVQCRSENTQKELGRMEQKKVEVWWVKLSPLWFQYLLCRWIQIEVNFTLQETLFSAD